MDQEILVDSRVQDGQEVIAKLIRANFDVTVAFWVKTSEEGLWYFYIGTTAMDALTVGMAYGTVYQALGRVSSVSLSLSDIKLVSPTDPVAAHAIEMRDRYRARLATRYRGPKLGNLAIEEAYIYPRASGPMTRSEVLQTVANLMSRTGALAPSLITLRDHTQIQAIPVGVQANLPDEVQVVFRDLVASIDRSVSVDDVVSIL